MCDNRDFSLHTHTHVHAYISVCRQTGYTMNYHSGPSDRCKQVSCNWYSVELTTCML